MEQVERTRALPSPVPHRRTGPVCLVLVLALAGCTAGSDDPGGATGGPTTPASGTTTASSPPLTQDPSGPTPTLGPTASTGPGDATTSPGQASVTVTFDDDGAIGEALRQRIREATTDTAVDVRRALPDLPTNLALQVRATGADDVNSATGERAGLELVDDRPTIVWRVDPAHEAGVEGIVDARLACMLAHEWHHQARGWGLGADDAAGLRETVVAEGMATAFARNLTGCAPQWSQYGEPVVGWANRIRREGDTATIDEWMVEHPDGQQWIGYRVGTWWADTAARASGTSPAELVHAPASGVVMLVDHAQGELDPADRYPVVLDLEVSDAGDAMTFDATISSPWDGPDQHADAFRVATVDGPAVGVRELPHPHADEQPFTRSLADVTVPEGTNQVVVTARDSVNGWSPHSLVVDLPTG